MTFLEIIRHLEDHWSQQGFAVIPSWDKPVGAGTLAPHTAMRLIGKEACQHAYLQPCRRPVDERDATHTQRHHQFQVISRPVFSDPKKVFADSLRDIIDRPYAFAEDEWAHPAIGASGKGWEVSAGKLEVAQITKFRTIGRRECEPATEFAYGLERLAMISQGVSSIYKIKWDDNHMYGEIYPRADEDTIDTYNSKYSHILNLQKELNGRLSKYQNSRGLAFYENILEASHIINLLEARDALTPEAKTYYIRQVCDLMEMLVVNDFGEVPVQPHYQIYHPKLGNALDRDARVAEITPFVGVFIAIHIERLVGLWGIGERTSSNANDPYKLLVSASALEHLNVIELSNYIGLAEKLHAKNNRLFDRDSMDELKQFIVNAVAINTPSALGEGGLSEHERTREFKRMNHANHNRLER